jgi:hypothetical protein
MMRGTDLMETRCCPKCNAASIVPGGMVSRSGEGACVAVFAPVGMSRWRFAIGVGLAREVFACLSCGFVWTSTDPAALRGFVKKHATELGRQFLDSLELGPAHGVPDIPEARAAAERASEIDALLMAGQHGPATRHYREWTACKWHDAHEALGKWSRLKREEKLALLGWASKESLKVKDSDLAPHPMRDPLLDG